MRDENQTKDHSKARRVLELQEVTFGQRSDSMLCLRRSSFTMHPAELMTIRTHPSQSTRRFASMLQGLVPPASGSVLFSGRNWVKQHMRTQFHMRSKMGRVFENQGWIANLNVRENLLLAKQHHGADLEEIEKQLTFWIDWFQMEKVTRLRSSSVDSSQLKIYQWIRAFLGPPTLLILERPMRAVSSKFLEAFAGAIRHMQSLGTAVIWIDGDTIEKTRGIVTSDLTLDLRPNESPSSPNPKPLIPQTNTTAKQGPASSAMDFEVENPSIDTADSSESNANAESNTINEPHAAGSESAVDPVTEPESKTQETEGQEEDASSPEHPTEVDEEDEGDRS